MSKLVRIAPRRDELRPIRLHHGNDSGIAFPNTIAVRARECNILRCIFRAPDGLDFPSMWDDVPSCDFDRIAYVVDEYMYWDTVALNSRCGIDRWSSEQGIAVELRGIVIE